MRPVLPLRPIAARFAGFAAMIAMAALASCADRADDDVMRVAFIGSGGDLVKRGVRLAPPDQHLRAAIAEGLVGLNAQGEVVPALAERWIVTDDGLSYIFRLRNSNWADGTRLTGANVRGALQQNLRKLEGTSLGLDLAIIDEVRAMTGRVVEIRLKSPMPQFLQLLAQPELGLMRANRGAGPMLDEIADNTARLTVTPPEARGAPDDPDWQRGVRQIEMSNLTAAQAVRDFDAGKLDIVLNGHLLSLPLADRGPLARGTVRLDTVFGLFGLQVMSNRGLLTDPGRREALAMAIERETLLEPFGIGSWAPSTRMIPEGLPSSGSDGAVTRPAERWSALSIDQRRATARARIAAWSDPADTQAKTVSIDLPQRAGTDLFVARLARDFATIGVTLRRARPGEAADLQLVDRVARYGDPRWFLNQFNCRLTRSLRRNLQSCAADADALVAETLTVTGRTRQARLLNEAEQALLSANVYIPIGAPVRWSLIRSGVDGFAENPWGLHPLFPMATRPI